jgi:hypothetical protein
MKKFRGHRRCTHRVASEHRGGQDGRYDGPKKKRRKSRSSNDVMRNGFPNRSIRREKQEGVEDALVEKSPSIKAGSMAGLMLQKRRKLSHGLDRTKCRDTQISQHGYKESGRADLREVL